MICFRFANVNDNTTIINSFNGNNSNIANTNTQCRQIMTIITKGILKFEPMIKKLILTNHKFFA